MSSENGGFNSSKPASEVMSEFEGVLRSLCIRRDREEIAIYDTTTPIEFGIS